LKFANIVRCENTFDHLWSWSKLFSQSAFLCMGHKQLLVQQVGGGEMQKNFCFCKFKPMQSQMKEELKK